MKYLLGSVVGIILASICHAVTRTRTYSRIVRWIWLADVRRTDPQIYGWGRG